VGLYSALSGQSVMYFLYWPLLQRLVRRLRDLVLVYVLTLPLLAASVALAYAGLFRDARWVVAAGVLLPVAMFLHARLLGRLAWLICYRTPIKARKRRPRTKPAKKPKVEVIDPWSFPEDEKLEPEILEHEVLEPEPEPAAHPMPEMLSADDDDLRLEEPYGVMTEDQARKSWTGKRIDRPFEEGYALAPQEPAKPAGETGIVAGDPLDKLPPLKLETAVSTQPLRSSRTTPPAAETPSRPPIPPEPLLKEERLHLEQEVPPQYVFWSGILAFPFYPRSLGPLCWLIFGGTVELFLVHLLISIQLG
jgi:hypothetical protein